jgi:prepilin-type N-terminal cleavage/methylation domain-containing protein
MKKGFTLMELMVVMAIMSILLLAVMSMTTPASRIFRRTAISDNVYSAADNITGYLQRTLEYADNVWVFDSTAPEATDLEKTAKSFKDCYYKGVIKGQTGNTWKYVSGQVHILHLSNTDGKIKETVYEFSDSNGSAMSIKKNNEDVLNPLYFKGDYADYNFRYALGASVLEPVLDGGEKKMVGSEIVYCLKAEKDKEKVFGDLTTQAITLVANRNSTKPAKVDDVYEFVGPCVATVANLPFTNITSRKGIDGTQLPNSPVYRLVVPGGVGSTEIFGQRDVTHIPVDYQICYDRQAAVGVSTPSPTITKSFSNFATGKDITLDNDIYFVFSYADELK